MNKSTSTTYTNSNNTNKLQVINAVNDQMLNIQSTYNPHNVSFIIKNILLNNMTNSYGFIFQLSTNGAINDYTYILNKNTYKISGPNIMINPGDTRVYNISLDTVVINNNKVSNSEFAIT
jgi:hypothetical protein